MDTDPLLTLGHAALRIGAQYHHLDRLARRGRLAHVTAGRLRLVRESDLPAIRDAVEAAGYPVGATPTAGAAR